MPGEQRSRVIDQRRLKDLGLEEGVSTRLLIYAGQLILSGIASRRACELTVAKSITDDPETERAVQEIIHSIFDK